MTQNRDPRLRIIETGVIADRVDQFLVFALDWLFGGHRRFLKSAVAAFAPLALAACDGALSVVDPAGPAARAVATLWWVMLGGAALICALVAVLIVLAFGPRRTPASTRIWIVGLGLVFPSAVLAALTAYGLVIGERLLARQTPDVVSVRAEGRQWSWRFAYADAAGRVTEDVLHIPAGRPVDVTITSADVIHSFWVPRLAGKLDAIPGHVNVLRIEADRPGTYAGNGAEFNGRDYLNHGFIVIAHGRDDWLAFLRGAAE